MLDNSAELRARPQNMQLVEHAFVRWYIDVPPEVTIEHVLEPAFWSHAARSLRPHQRVVVDCQDQSWTAELFVRDVSRASAQMAVISFIDFDRAMTAPALDAVSEEKYRVEFKGPRHKYRVLRLRDNEIMTSGLSKADAYSWVSQRAGIEAR